MSKFKVGDKVQIMANNAFPYHSFLIGETVEVLRLPDKCCKSLFCCRVGDRKRTQYINPACVEIVPKPADKIIVTTDGKNTIARLFSGKELVKSAIAKCSPKDEFVFEIGAALALDRLLDREAKADPEAPEFPSEKLQPGVFGRMSNGNWFVIVGEDFIYESGGFDRVSYVNSEGCLDYYKIDCLVRACSFNDAKAEAGRGRVIWSRPGIKF